MGYIDTFEMLRAKLKYGVNIRDQICNLPFSNLLKNELILLCLVATLKMMVKQFTFGSHKQIVWDEGKEMNENEWEKNNLKYSFFSLV